jgi:hypothetical protein
MRASPELNVAAVFRPAGFDSTPTVLSPLRLSREMPKMQGEFAAN